MRWKLRHAALLAVLAAIGLAGSAQANVQIPGINGKIAFDSTRDYPFQAVTTKGFSEPTCAQQTDTPDCSIEIYSMNPDGSAQTRLTNNLAGDIEPAWLPSDGSTIAFSSNRADCGNGNCAYDIFSMPGGGETVAAATQLTSDIGDEVHPSYSPDGTRIAYAGLNQANTAPATGRQIVYQAFEPWEIFTIPSGGESAGAPVPLLPSGQTGLLSDGGLAVDFYPAWSPDGTKVAFTRLSEMETSPSLDLAQPTQVLFDYRTWVAPAAGTGPATPVEKYDPCIVNFISGAQLKSVNAAVSRSIASGRLDSLRSALRGLGLQPGCTWDFKPAWSPEGSKIAVTREAGGAPPVLTAPSTRGFTNAADFGDIVVVDPGTGSDLANLSDVTEPANCNTGPDTPFCSVDEYPSWSPDGTKIAFDSDRGADGAEPRQCIGEIGDGCFNVWTINADGTDPAQLTASGAGEDNFFPDWQRIPLPPAPQPVQPAAPTVPPKVGVAGVRRACVSSSFHVRFRISTTGTTVKRVVVKLDGRRIKSTTKGGFTLTINGKKLKSGRHRLTITATDSAGHVTTTRKSFSVCKAAKPRRKAAPRFTG